MSRCLSLSLVRQLADRRGRSAVRRRRRQPSEWSQWRGPNRDGISPENGLLKEWPAAGPPRTWQTTGAGTGYSSFSSSGGRLYTIGAREDVEYVMAFDRATGRKLWETPNGRRFRNEQGDGPRSTPTTEGDVLYAFGGSGELSCLEAATGRKIWSVNVVQKFGGSTPYWGYSESPLIVGDRIIVNAGGRRSSLVAVNKATGAPLWQQPGDEAGYSSPMLLSTGSLQQVVFFTAERGLAVDPRDGRQLWSYDRASNGTANIATPIVRGNRVFFSSDYGTGAALLDVRAVGQPGQRRRGLFHARYAEPPRLVRAGRLAPLRFQQFHPDRAGVRHRHGRLAQPERGERLARLCRRAPVSLQRERGGGARRRVTGGLRRAWTLHALNRQREHLEPSDHHERDAHPAGPGQGVRV